MEKMYHIGLDNTVNAKYAILPGDPDRVPKIAQYLKNPKFVCQNREYHTWVGEISGENVLVTSTGIGGPSTAISVEELYKVGVTNFIRIGTCGGMDLDVLGGDIVIANGAIKMDGTSKEYVPVEFPAISNFYVTEALIKSVKSLELPFHVGVVQCKDSFYGQHEPDRMPVSYDLKNKWESFIMAGCLASEMESSTLFTVAQILGCRAGCVLCAVWNQEREKKGLENVHCHDTENAIKVAIKAVENLILNK